MVGGDNIPTVVVTADQNELLPNHNPTKQPQSNSAAHLNVVNKTTRLRSLSSPIKVQVAQPPVASSLEVNDAIFKLRGCSMLSNNVSILLGCIFMHMNVKINCNAHM